MITPSRRAAFTLVELAIVLVIIGLLVGGVLVGQDLIKAAEINATAAQMGKYDTAANTFRTKYKGLPGDLANPNQYPISSNNANGTMGRANNDGRLQPGSCTNANGYGGESALFWTHLSETNLIPDGVNGINDYTAVAALTITDRYMPSARLGNSNRFHVTSVGNRNFYLLTNFTDTTVTTCALTTADAMTPLQALQLDSKLDDGNAASGIVVSVSNAAAPGTIGGGSATPDATGTDDCYDSDDGSYATTTDALASALQCQLRIRTSF